MASLRTTANPVAPSALPDKLEVAALLCLEASLFFSFPCWEMVSSFAWPAVQPVRFFTILVLSACAAAVVFHVIPARIGALGVSFPAWIRWPVAAILLAGFSEWALTLWAGAGDIMPWPKARLATLALVAFLAAFFAFSRWWAQAGLIAFALGVAAALLCFVGSLPGLAYQNPHSSGERPTLEDAFLHGILVTAAPVIVLAWRHGQLRPSPKTTMLSAAYAVALPMVVAVTLTAIAVMAGVRRFYRPSLPRGLGNDSELAQ